MRLLCSRYPVLMVAMVYCAAALGQSPPAQRPPAPPAQTLAQKPGSVMISLEDAIQMALRHNHNILAARTTIQQSQAEEITANLRPDPTLIGDAEYLSPTHPTTDYLNNSAEFDLGISYLFERGKNAQPRL